MKGKQTAFVTLFDLTAKLSKAKNIYSLIDYYAKMPILCLDELGYVIPSKEQADAIFQIISKRSETGTSIISRPLRLGQDLRYGNRIGYPGPAQPQRTIHYF
jgi:DNA replication protein DnaC